MNNLAFGDCPASSAMLVLPAAKTTTGGVRRSVGSLLLAMVLVGCARECPKVGISTEGLVKQTTSDACRVVVEPAFSEPYSVSVTQPLPSTIGTVLVETLADVESTATGPNRFSAPLDPATARTIVSGCQRAQAVIASSCRRLGRDGIWYHLATSASGNGAVVFWSPQPETTEGAVVHLVEALRDYAASPALFRREQLTRLRTAQAELSEVLVKNK